MGQHTRKTDIFTCFLVIAIAAVMASCRKHEAATTPPSATSPSHVRTIASLVPAATDILLEMGAADQLVGVSNYEPKTPELARFPRVGDYHVVDWEQLSVIRPNVMAITSAQKDLAEVFRQRAQSLGIDLVDIRMDRLEDIYGVIARLGDAIGQKPKADVLLAQMHQQIEAVQAQVAGKPRVGTLMALNHAATFIVGPRNYLDDLLTVAGGSNVAGTGQKDYPEIDREMLLQLDPDAIILLLPEAPPQVIEAAKTFFAGLPQLKAVHSGRLYIHTEWYLMLPGARARNVAQIIANDLHPLTTTAPATTTVAQ